MKTRFAPWANPVRQDARIVRSSDGTVVVTMRRAGEGVFVERTMQRPGTARVVHATVFSSSTNLQRWCDADVMRFEHPLVLRDLMRHADELFNSPARINAPG